MRAAPRAYQLMGRGRRRRSAEGSSIWTTEYLRYHQRATTDRGQNVFSQIDGGPVPPTCQPHAAMC
jgi:hypothetical protein